MGIFDDLAAQQPNAGPTHTAPGAIAPAPQQFPDPPDGYRNPMKCDRELSGLAQRDKWGRVCASLSGRPLPPNVIATGYVINPATGGYTPIEQPSIPITNEVSQMLEHAANEHAKYTLMQMPAAPAYTPPAPPASPPAPQTFAGYAPPGMQPPPAATPAAPQFRPPLPPGINPPEASAPPPAPSFVPPPAPQAPAQEAPAKRRGRPTNAERAARANGEAPPAPAPVGTPGPVAALQISSPEDVSRDRGFSLFLDCIPVVGFDADNYDLADIVEKVRPSFRANHQVEDYSLVDFKGPALLAHYVEGAIRELLKEGDVNLTINSHTREAHACMSRLLPLAGTVVRGA
jgi:hypothetical protein